MKQIVFIISLIVGFAFSAEAQNYKVIVNQSNSQSTITKKEASSFFLKKKSKWASGEKVKAVDQTPKSTTRSSFSSEVLGKSIGQIRAFWQQSVFSGGATPPQEMKSDAEVIQYVKANKGAIGYVSAGANTAGVKVITVQ